MKKVYLGDSVYADFDGFHVVLTTENGFGPTNTIMLEDTVLNALNKYVLSLKPEQSQADNGGCGE